MTDKSQRYQHYPPELIQLEQIVNAGRDLFHVQTLAQIDDGPHQLPIYQVVAGNPSAQAPAVAFIGGVHGIERIGSQIVLAYMASLVERFRWDETLHHLLEKIRILFIPLVNPYGVRHGTRANGSGVDIMRNAPVDAQERPPYLVGGHRLSAKLPWYRGRKGAAMATESQALCQSVRRELFPSPFSLSVDFHSGFGAVDRLWFPYANNRYQMIDHLPEMYQFHQLFVASHPHHDYIFEPQSRHYTTHGDIWDYLYDQARNRQQVFLPLTLEMGSWRWLKKNPAQARSFLGYFHPIKPHRIQRVLRRHYVLMDFCLRATAASQSWLRPDHNNQLLHQAQQLWYPDYSPNEVK